ncbi:MAG TPA: hypothetical protein P5556_07350 [Candidatus Gastranaerophilales bacterium]|nr:hypothetical protein [Candidatus Gastranaerophilales bacterium]
MGISISSLQSVQDLNIQNRDNEIKIVEKLEAEKVTAEDESLELTASILLCNQKISNTENKVQTIFAKAELKASVAENQISDLVEQKVKRAFNKAQDGEENFETLISNEFSGLIVSNYFSEATFTLSETDIYLSEISGMLSFIGELGIKITDCKGKLSSITSQIATSLGSITTYNKAIDDTQLSINSLREQERAAQIVAGASFDPYETQIDNENYIFIKDINQNLIADDKTEILGISDTLDNRFAEMRSLDSNEDNKVSKDELVSADVKLMKVNSSGQLTYKSLDMNKFEEIDLDSFEEINAGDYAGAFDVKLADKTTADATVSFKDDNYFDKLFSGSGEDFDSNKICEQTLKRINELSVEKIGISQDIFKSQVDKNNDVTIAKEVSNSDIEIKDEKVLSKAEPEEKELDSVQAESDSSIGASPMLIKQSA